MIGNDVAISKNAKSLSGFKGIFLFGCVYRNNGKVEFSVCSPDEWNSIKENKKYTNPGYHIINVEKELAYKLKISDVYHEKIFLKKYQGKI